MGGERITMPLRACHTHIGSVVDDDGEEILVVDPNGDLPDEVVAERVAVIVDAVNRFGGFAKLGNRA